MTVKTTRGQQYNNTNNTYNGDQGRREKRVDATATTTYITHTTNGKLHHHQTRSDLVRFLFLILFIHFKSKIPSQILVRFSNRFKDYNNIFEFTQKGIISVGKIHK